MGLNRPKRRNPPCDAPLCVVSSFFSMGKEEREGAAQGGFLLLGLFIISCVPTTFICKPNSNLSMRQFETLSSEEYFLNIRGHQVFDMAQVKLDQPCGGTTEMVGPNKTMCTLNIESQTCGLSMSMNNTHVSYETTVKTEANEMNFPNGNTTIIT